MDIPDNQNEKYVRTLSILHLALMVGQTAFIGVVAVLHKMGMIKPSISIDRLYIWVGLICAVLLMVSGVLFRNRLNGIRAKQTLDEKLFAYRVALITRYAIVEVAFFFSTIFFLVNGTRWLIYFSVVILLLFFLLRPTAAKVQQDLELSADEMAGLGQSV